VCVVPISSKVAVKDGDQDPTKKHPEENRVLEEGILVKKKRKDILT